MKIEVSSGEIVDKFTILKIKLKNSNSKEKTEQILRELNYLEPLVEELKVSENLIKELQDVNQKIWDTEDSIRLCEKNKQFDDTFVQLARDVYFNNDRRFEVKTKINQQTNSYINEQKILPKYI
jgi:uncharacterized UPF0160 family protein